MDFSHTRYITDRNAVSTFKSQIDSHNQCGAFVMGKECRGEEIWMKKCEAEEC